MLRGILAMPASSGGRHRRAHAPREILRQASKRYTLVAHEVAPVGLESVCSDRLEGGGGAPSWCVSSQPYVKPQVLHLRTEICCVHSCCPEPHYSLPLRPLGQLEPAGGAAASGTALPYSHTFILAPGGARGSLHQLAAGSTVELPRPTGLSRRNA